MKLVKKLHIVVIAFVFLIVSLTWCSLTFYQTFSQCDLDGYLTDQKTDDELFAALEKIERQHNLNFDYSLAAPMCTSHGIATTLVYKTPERFSMYGFVYKLLVSAVYSPNSGSVTLRVNEKLLETEATLTYIDSAQETIRYFETLPQVREFAWHFRNEGIDIRGTVYEDALWIETDPSLRFSKDSPTLSARIFYSMSTRSFISYSLPNRLTWQEFPEILQAHEIVTENLLVGDLAKCYISTAKRAFVNTDVYFLPEAPSTKINVKIDCDNEPNGKNLSLVLHPDGSYESQGVR